VHVCVRMPACAVSCGPGACARERGILPLARTHEVVVVVCTAKLLHESYGLQTQRTNPGNLSSLAGTTDGSLAHAKYEVGIREHSPGSQSSLAILPMYNPEVAGMLASLIAGVSRYGSVHFRGGGRQESTTGPLHMWPSSANVGLEPPTFGS